MHESRLSACHSPDDQSNPKLISALPATDQPHQHPEVRDCAQNRKQADCRAEEIPATLHDSSYHEVAPASWLV
jgi:hypothetical protein